VPSIQ